MILSEIHISYCNLINPNNGDLCLKHENKNIIVFTGPFLQPTEAKQFLEADYRPPVARDDVIKALRDNPDIIVIIDGVFHKAPQFPIKR